MSPCPACATPTADGSHYCPDCGTDLRLPDSPTGTAPRPLRSPRTPASPAAASPDAAARGGSRFAAGHVLAERYRIVGLVGRGGMGEVYRADDLKLEQAVALKFLTPLLAADPERIERLYAEVRTARQVSHPSVCRVWDIGEADGHHFLSMEFVDGENLASLLRRIGRFPQDKAKDVARQVADGLAAAHAKGLLHRDLKPANVMLDGEGHVRLTDFGLAGFADALAGDVRSGTPSYMAPEQLLGREVSARSDLYALGLLMYELVTGRRAFEGKGYAELARRHRDERPLEPSALIPGVDPAFERTILACLEKEPRRRPPSALAVAAMLAGRDPLEAAIAAGETPSPELVAAAGETEGMRPATARACLAAVVAGLVVFPILAAPRHLLSRIPVEKSPAALEDRARELLGRLVDTPPVDHDMGLTHDSDYLQWAREPGHATRRFEALGAGEPPLVEFWYRQSPRPLAARSAVGRVTRRDPPIEIAGMAGAGYDLRGRLVSFYAVPPQLERNAGPDGASPSRPAPGEPDWTPLFAEARLDPSRLRRVEPQWTPPFYVDARAAWEGHWPTRPEISFRVEAAAYRGRPVWFEVKDPWTRAEREVASSLTPLQRRLQAFYVSFLVALLAVGCGLAYRNISMGRGDRRGAFRLALALAALAIASWALRAHHAAEPATEFGTFAMGAGLSLLVAAIVWLLYLALEPYVRRLRPWTLVAWARVLNGGVRDPVVGRDVLAGMCFGTGLAITNALARAFEESLGYFASPPESIGLDIMMSTRLLLSYLFASPVDATVGGLALLLLFLVLRLLTRRDWIAATLVVAFLVSGDLAEAGAHGFVLWLLVPVSVAAWSGFVLLMLRLGVLAAITAVWTTNLLVLPSLAYAPGRWTGDAVYLVLPLLLGVAVLAFRSASGGHLGVRRYLAGEASGSRA